MEIVIAILVLFGVAAASSNSSSSDAGRTDSGSVTESEQNTPMHRVEAALGPCRFHDGRLIHRDLTVPRASASGMSKVNSKEAGHDCANRQAH